MCTVPILFIKNAPMLDNCHFPFFEKSVGQVALNHLPQANALPTSGQAAKVLENYVYYIIFISCGGTQRESPYPCTLKEIKKIVVI